MTTTPPDPFVPDPLVPDPLGSDTGHEPVSPRTVFRWGVFGALGFLVVALGVGAVYTLRNLLVQILIAVFIAVSLDPAVRWLIRHRIRRPYAVAIIFLLFLAILVGLMWAFIPPLVKQANSLTNDFPGYLDNLRNRSPGLARLEERLNLHARIDALARELPGKLGAEALGFGQRFLGALLSVLLVTVLTIYLMLDLARLRRGLVRLFPKHQRTRASEIVNLVVEKVGSYMIGNLVISLVAGATALMMLYALKVPFALPLAVVVAVTDLIPLIGATVGAGISVVVAAATVDFWPGAVVLALFFIVYQQVENYVIAPRVLRNTVDIPSIAVLVAALVGASVLGVVGALMAIPVAAVLKVLGGERIRARDSAEADQAGAKRSGPAAESSDLRVE